MASTGWRRRHRARPNLWPQRPWPPDKKDIHLWISGILMWFIWKVIAVTQNIVLRFMTIESNKREVLTLRVLSLIAWDTSPWSVPTFPLRALCPPRLSTSLLVWQNTITFAGDPSSECLLRASWMTPILSETLQATAMCWKFKHVIHRHEHLSLTIVPILFHCYF